MLTDIARCTKYPPVYVFFVGGLTQGTEVRWLNKRVQRRKTTSASTSSSRSSAALVSLLALAKHPQRPVRFRPGRRPAGLVSPPLEPPPDDSVDVGREGRLMDERLDTGKITPRTYHAVNSEDAEDVVDEIIEFRVNVLKKIEDRPRRHRRPRPDYKNILEQLTYDQIFRESRTAISVAETAADLEDDDEAPPLLRSKRTAPTATASLRVYEISEPRITAFQLFSVSAFSSAHDQAPIPQQTPQLRLGLG
jgi:hypothetical protein